MDRRDILKTVEKVICNDRHDQYGNAEDSFSDIATFWETYLAENCVSAGADLCISRQDVAAMMVLLKVARLKRNAKHMDSWVDIAGYAALGGEIGEQFLALVGKETPPRTLTAKMEAQE